MKETKDVENEEYGITEVNTQETNTGSHIVSLLHDLWVGYGYDSMKVVLFLEEWKTYWQIRATAEMCERDGALADFLKRGIETGIRESL